ncbi:MAG: CHAT domain-containing protein [Crocinitomicaceae bacterium]|nr:CHAT domain-containing protein [Crocinitomicaceae bacterium]
MKWFITVLFLLLFSTTFHASKTPTRYFQEKENEISHFIYDGHYNNALLKCDQLLAKQLNKDQRYKILSIQSKIHFWNDNMYAYRKTAEEAYQLKKKDSPIYKAYFHAQLGYFYHFSFVGDSALIHAEKALKLLHNNYSERSKISAHFIYHIYGTCEIYRKRYYFDSGNEIESKHKRIEPIMNYLDSALLIFNETPYFPQEKAIILRSKGSRMFDLVGYDIRSKPSDFIHPKFEKEVLSKVISFYKQAENCLPKKEKSLRTNINGVLSMAFYCNNQPEKGDSICLPYIEKYSRNPIGEILPCFLNSMSVLDYFTKNAILRNSNKKELTRLLEFNKQILPYWRMYLQQENLNFFDAYNNSPVDKIILLLDFFKDKNDIENRHCLSEFAFEKFSYFSKVAINKVGRHIINKNAYQKLLAQIERKPTDFLSLNKLSKTASKVEKLIAVKQVQSKLKTNEAVLLVSSSSGHNAFHICILKNSIKVFRLKKYQYFFQETRNNEFNTPQEIKKRSSSILKEAPHISYLVNQKIKKLYVASNIEFPFDWLVINSKGNEFHELSFFKKQINVVKMFNPIDFFTSKPTESLIHRKTTSFWLNKRSVGKLPYTEKLMQKLTKNPTVFSEEDLKSEGVLQVVGHGDLSNNKFHTGQSSSLEYSELNQVRNKEFKVESDLVIFNVCFGGIKRNLNLFDMNLNNLLISRGAKAVIASPNQTVDQSSAYIFERFYKYLFKGETAEDALHQAKIDYLNTHRGIWAHPMYWSMYELTSNVKDLRLAPEPMPDKSWQAFLMLFVLVAIVIRFYLFWED